VQTPDNWNSGEPDKSLPWFQSLGNPQILFAGYDADSNSIKSWHAAAQGKEKIVGVMYTTWANKYGDLEIFAKAAWGGG